MFRLLLHLRFSKCNCLFTAVETTLDKKHSRSVFVLRATEVSLQLISDRNGPRILTAIVHVCSESQMKGENNLCFKCILFFIGQSSKYFHLNSSTNRHIKIETFQFNNLQPPQHTHTHIHTHIHKLLVMSTYLQCYIITVKVCDNYIMKMKYDKKLQMAKSI